MQHALWQGRGAGRVDEIGGIVGGGVGVRDGGPFAQHAGDGIGVEHAQAGGHLTQAKVAVEGDRLGAAVLQQELHLVLGELRRRRQRHEAAGDGPEEQQRVGAGVFQAQEDARRPA